MPAQMHLLFARPSAPATDVSTLSLHDALPIFLGEQRGHPKVVGRSGAARDEETARRLWQLSEEDRKSTRLNSSHLGISYAVFCLKKKKTLTIASVLNQFARVGAANPSMRQCMT